MRTHSSEQVDRTCSWWTCCPFLGWARSPLAGRHASLQSTILLDRSPTPFAGHLFPTKASKAVFPLCLIYRAHLFLSVVECFFVSKRCHTPWTCKASGGPLMAGRDPIQQWVRQERQRKEFHPTRISLLRRMTLSKRPSGNCLLCGNNLVR